jgi:hypothetical protein
MKLAALALLALTACASVPVDDTPDIVKKTRRCLESEGGCLVVQVENRNYSDVGVYLHGGRIATVNGFGQGTLFISRSDLDGDGCVYFLLRLFAGTTFQTSRECPQGDEYLRLAISSLLSTTNLSRVVIR